MNAQTRRELYSIKEELILIITELENISYGVGKDFIGIGSDKCSGSLNLVIDDYYKVQRKLNNMDTSTVTESFARAHGGSY